MLNQLIFRNIYFIVYVFAALSFFASGWIHIDSWRVNKKNISYIYRSIGFFAISVALLIISTQSTHWLLDYSQNVFKILGGLMIFVSLIAYPLTKNPTVKSLFVVNTPSLAVITKYLTFASPIVFFATSIAYLIRMTLGMEKQTKGVVISIFIFTIADALRILFNWSDSNVVFVSKILSQYGLLTIIILALTFLSSLVLLIWVWGYVRFRTGIQVFFTTLTFTLFIFVITTFSFTFLLLKSIQNDILESLSTDAKVVQYTIEGLQFQALANVKAASLNANVINSTTSKKPTDLYKPINAFMIDQNLDFLDITDANGKLVLAGEDEESPILSLSEDPTFQSASQGVPLAATYIKNLANSPVIVTEASSPISQTTGGKIYSVVSTGYLIDNAFLDGIKETTGIEISIYAGDIKSASTIISQQNQSRLVGSQETNKNILETVLNKGESWTGPQTIADRPYYFAYIPIRKMGGTPIGMIAVGKPQIILAQTAQKFMDTTFLVSAILMLLSAIPAYYISKFIEENVTA